ncbi:OLC1v1038798C1 [Oldenlandia corymbosa var. corymbosa]|uniref:OLC1v1038798C1 n=1 Tax=Oldenlandia corymbosa var. corymbosa TaxID=529605 RepID=A0AAV1D1A4_OLDCO|nr:OLC1v1038798C1 [Oldenlandia corymbosa var. corymbosa]
MASSLKNSFALLDTVGDDVSDFTAPLAANSLKSATATKSSSMSKPQQRRQRGKGPQGFRPVVSNQKIGKGEILRVQELTGINNREKAIMDKVATMAELMERLFWQEIWWKEILGRGLVKRILMGIDSIMEEMPTEIPEKKKALEALKKKTEERKVAMDEFEGMQIVGRKKKEGSASFGLEKSTSSKKGEEEKVQKREDGLQKLRKVSSSTGIRVEFHKKMYHPTRVPADDQNKSNQRTFEFDPP